jgi:hypothetical protein
VLKLLDQHPTLLKQKNSKPTKPIHTNYYYKVLLLKIYIKKKNLASITTEQVHANGLRASKALCLESVEEKSQVV